MQMYLNVVRSHSRYRDIEMLFPEMSLPPELESAEPPPLLPLDATENEREMHQ